MAIPKINFGNKTENQSGPSTGGYKLEKEKLEKGNLENKERNKRVALLENGRNFFDRIDDIVKNYKTKLSKL